MAIIDTSKIIVEQADETRQTSGRVDIEEAMGTSHTGDKVSRFIQAV